MMWGLTTRRPDAADTGGHSKLIYILIRRESMFDVMTS